MPGFNHRLREWLMKSVQKSPATVDQSPHEVHPA
jgi:hypothetical protein